MFKRLQFWVKISKLLAAGGGAKTPLALPIVTPLTKLNYFFLMWLAFLIFLSNLRLALFFDFERKCSFKIKSV